MHEPPLRIDVTGHAHTRDNLNSTGVNVDQLIEPIDSQQSPRYPAPDLLDTS